MESKRQIYIEVFFVLLMTSSLVQAKTIIIKPDKSGDFATIQAAIDAAEDGDEIVLEQGIYTGAGNRDLNYKGKAITIRSRYPDDNECMRNTIIDAQGEGVIVRFIDDEGPGSVFKGFTLGAGDTTKNVLGDPGFFEFSKNARPTTRRLRNKPVSSSQSSTFVESPITTSEIICPGLDDSPDGRIWDGHNPFHQPANTTNYYGSGDIDLDGLVTITDKILLEQIINGTYPANIRADINGDGIIDSTDTTLLDGALSSGTLPAWWNQLTTRQQRNDWIDIFLALEKTNEHIYTPNFFVCHHFAYQTSVHGAFRRDDFAVIITNPSLISGCLFVASLEYKLLVSF